MKKLAIVTTHPIQYYAPIFKLLAQRNIIQVRVFYTWEQSQNGEKYDPGFGKKIEWDIPLLEDYDYTFVKNISTNPGTHHFKGIINPSLIKEIQEYNPAAILTFGWNFDSHLKCIRFFHKKIPVLFRGDSTLLDEKKGFSIKKIARRIFLKWIYKHVDIAFYTGINNKQYFSVLGLKDNQLVFAPHAIDNNRFGNEKENYAQQALAQRQKLGIKNDELVILFAGKFEPKKDPAIILQLAKKLRKEKIKFLLVGNGILEKDLKAAAFNNQKIHFLDFQNQQLMPVIYRLGDVFLLPSKGPGETWGLAVNESMASGKPILISNKCGCAADLVINGKTGYIFSATNESDLLEKFQLMNNKDLLIELGNASKELIQEYSFEKIVSAIESSITI